MANQYPNSLINMRHFRLLQKIFGPPLKRLISKGEEKQELVKGKTHKKSISSTIEPNIKVAPRSSNLRVKREFTDIERSKFLLESFEYVVNFADNSLAELEDRAVLRSRLSSDELIRNHFVAKIYKNGNLVSECKIWVSSDYSSHGTIKYSNTISAYDNSFNASVDIGDDGYTLGLKPFLVFPGHKDNELFSKEGAAELFWSLLMEPLQ